MKVGDIVKLKSGRHVRAVTDGISLGYIGFRGYALVWFREGDEVVEFDESMQKDLNEYDLLVLQSNLLKQQYGFKTST